MLLHHLLKPSKQCRHYVTVGMTVALTISAMLDTSKCAKADIIEDKTLPNNSTVKFSDQKFRIEGGTQIGKNLFHSFSEFSLPQDYTAHFNNQVDIQNIFSRVTGSQASDINGLIQANHVANLFIINPNGITFGPNARLHLGGSFFASTANSISFVGGERFSAKPEDSTPLLTVNTPIGLQVGINAEKDVTVSESFQNPVGVQFGSKPGEIRVQGKFLNRGILPATLQVDPNQTLALVGGDIFLENSHLSTLKADGRIELGSVASEGFVGLTPTKLGMILSFDAAPNLSNINILPNTTIDSLGDLQITAKNIFLNNGFLTVGNELRLNATDNIQLLNDSYISSNSLNIPSRNFTINTQNLLLQDAAYISLDNGNLTINASDKVELTSNLNDKFARTSRILTTAVGDTTQSVSNLTINTRHLLVKNGSQILTNTFGIARPTLSMILNFGETVKRGNLTVNATESVTLVGSSLNEVYPSGLLTRTFEGGDSGAIAINTKVLSIKDGAQVLASNSSLIKSGSVTVNATDKIELIGTSPQGRIFTDAQNNAIIDEPVIDTSLISFSSLQGVRIQNTLPSGLFSNAPNAGDAGDIKINTPVLVARDGGQISANALNKGRGGNLTIDATEQIQLLGASANGISSGLFTRSNPTASGDAGTLNILTGNLLVRDGAQVSASTFSTAKGGNLNVEATEGIKLIGVSRQNVASGLFTQANSRSRGDAGKLTIKTSTLLVQDGAQVSASTFSAGKGGNLTVQASESIELIGTSGQDNLFPSGLFAAAINSTGDAGNLIVETPSLLVRDGARISASTTGQGKGGNLTVTVKDRMQLIGTAVNGAFPSGLFATAASNSTGDAGNLIANTNLLQMWQGAGIAVQNLGLGSAGNLLVNARSIDMDNRAFISADTRGVSKNSNQPQANITLRSQDLLLLRGNSSITTNAFGDNVIGGNINIETKLLAAFDNSDISANSADFRGGRVQITAQGIAGTQFRNSLTPESDITATGATPELSGTVDITTSEVDPSRGLTELQSNLTDVSNQIAQKCRASEVIARQTNQFLITGKGGIPINPYEALQNESAIANWINVNNINSVVKNDTNYRKIPSAAETSIVEAQSLTIDPKGNLVLTAAAPNLNSQNPALTHPVCAS